MTHATNCILCGEPVDPKGLCPRCRRDQVVELSPAIMRMKVGEPTIISEETLAQDERRIVAGNSQGTSESHIDKSGNVTLRLSGVLKPGRAGERDVAHILETRLRELGRPVKIEPGDDHRGEDGVVRSSAGTHTLQIVVSPRAPELWRDAKRGSGFTQVELDKGVEWLRDAILAKADRTPSAERSRTVLAVDVRNAPVLTDARVLSKYLEQHGEPVVELGLAAVWLVGQPSSNCAQLGRGIL